MRYMVQKGLKTVDQGQGMFQSSIDSNEASCEPLAQTKLCFLAALWSKGWAKDYPRVPAGTNCNAWKEAEITPSATGFTPSEQKAPYKSPKSTLSRPTVRLSTPVSKNST